MNTTKKPTRKVIARNKKAYFDYFVEDDVEGGLALQGSEVKSVRAGEVNLKEGYVFIDNNNQVTLLNVHIKEFKQANINNHEPTRQRKILLHQKEIDKLVRKVSQKGYTLKPLEIYFKGKWAKVKIGLCRGKKKYDKRDVLKEKEQKREMDRVVKGFNKDHH